MRTSSWTACSTPCDAWEAFLLSGRSVPEIVDPAIREVVWREYRVVYWADEDRAEVLSVLHTSQPFGAAPPPR